MPQSTKFLLEGVFKNKREQNGVILKKRVGYNEESSGDGASGRIKIQTSVLMVEINIFWGESDMEVYNLCVSCGLLSRTLRG